MIGALGIVVVLGMVIGGYMWSGGKFDIIVKALPYEMTIIVGAAVGAFLIANDMKGIKHTLGAMKKVFAGPYWKPDDYRDLLCLLFELVRLSRGNAVALEEQIESPHTSEIFSRYPKIQKDDEIVDLICDTLRSASMNYDDPHQVEEVLEKRLETQLHHEMHASHAIQTVADGLPALGIVAAVLGVIKTMASIDQPPEILGGMIGGALVGTFLGVYLAYGFVGPFAGRVKAATEEDHQFYMLVREVLIANLYNHSLPNCIEVGRQNTPHHVRPPFSDLEGAIRDLKVVGG